MVALTLMDHLTRQRLMRGKKTTSGLRDTLALIDQDMALLKELRKRILPEIGKRSGRV